MDFTSCATHFLQTFQVKLKHNYYYSALAFAMRSLANFNKWTKDWKTNCGNFIHYRERSKKALPIMDEILSKCIKKNQSSCRNLHFVFFNFSLITRSVAVTLHHKKYTTGLLVASSTTVSNWLQQAGFVSEKSTSDWYHLNDIVDIVTSYNPNF